MSNKEKIKKMVKKNAYKPWHKEAKAGFPNAKKFEPVFGKGAFSKGFRKSKSDEGDHEYR